MLDRSGKKSAAALKCFVFVDLFFKCFDCSLDFPIHTPTDTLTQKGDAVSWMVAWGTIDSCISVSFLLYYLQFTASLPFLASERYSES